MSRSLMLWLAVAFVALTTAPARADVAPWPFKVPRPQPAAPPQIDPATGQPIPPQPKSEPPRTGPLRSCGSGAPLALAGIATAWGLMWLGGRVAGRVSRRA